MGKVQKIYNFDRISKESFVLYLLLGLLMGWIFGLLIASLKILYAGLVFLIITFFAWKKGKRILIPYVIAFFLMFSFSLIINLIPTKTGNFEGVGIVIGTKSNYYILLSNFKRYYVYDKDCTKEFGDIIKLNGYVSNCSFVEYESRFSFANYLESIGVKKSLNIVSFDFILKNPIRLRERELSFLSSFDPLTKGTIDMIAFSRKDYSNENVSLASSIGCLNILSASGIIYGGSLRVIEKIFSYKFDIKKRKLITFVFAIMLSIFFIGKIGAYRVILLRIIELAQIMLNKKKESHLFNLSLSGIILVLINPYSALNSGFLIGYGLSYFLVFAGSYFSKLKKPQRKLMTFILINIFLLPMFNIRGELILLAPLFSFMLMPITYSFALLSLISFISVPFVSLLGNYSNFLTGYLKFIDKISLSVPLGAFSTFSIYIYYLCIFLFLYFYNIGLTNIGNAFAYVQVISLVIPSLPIENAFVRQVSFINVGQGDSILIRDRNTSVLLDTGGILSFDLAKEITIPFLRKQKIYKLDCLIASHQDYDHIGAKDSLISNFSVKRYVSEREEFPLKIGDLTFVNYNTYSAEDENEKSLVLSLNFMGKDFLFTGDADITIEKKIIKDYPKLKTDILKIGHHGSKTSSSYEFLKQLSPEMCVISVGQNNKYGHPDDEVLNRLKKLNLKYRRTDLEGTITYKTFFNRPLGDL